MIRFCDILFSILGLIILFPFIAIISSIIVIDSKGPVFYKQFRVGRSNIDFKLIKFRTMHVDADKKGLLTVGERDPRVTKSGFILRKYKLDELPQLFNVLIGDMSLVGPRPEVRKYVALYTPLQLKVLSVKPGITDFASIEYSNENELLKKSNDPEKFYIEKIMPEKIELNMKFINNPSLGKYFGVILLTILKVFSSK